jgi:hypothetical protein
MKLSEILAQHVLPEGMKWHFEERHHHGSPLWSLLDGHRPFAHLSVKLNHRGDIAYVGYFHPRHHPATMKRFSTSDLDALLADIAAAVERT